MKQAEMTLLYEYNYWANRRILEAAFGISQEQFIAHTAFPRGSLRGTLVHILDAEYAWRMLLTEAGEVPDLAEADFPTLESLERRWQDEESAMRAYLAGLDDARLDGILRYTNVQGIRRERVLWHCLFQVLNHGTQHRSEAAAMLTDLGRSPGDLDFSFFLHDIQQQAA